MRWSNYFDRCLFCFLLCEELCISWDELCSGGADASEKSMIKIAQDRMMHHHKPTVQSWRQNECWDEEFMGYRVEEVFDIRNDQEFKDATGISMEQAGFATNFTLRGAPLGGTESVLISKSGIPRRLIAEWQAGFTFRQPQVRWMLAPQQALRKFNDLTDKEVKARGMNIEKVRHWKTTAEIDNIAAGRAKAIEDGQEQSATSDEEEPHNPLFVEEQARWSRPAAAVKSKAAPAKGSPAKLRSKDSEGAAASPEAIKSAKRLVPWGSPRRKKAQKGSEGQAECSPRVKVECANSVSRELGQAAPETASLASKASTKPSAESLWLVRGKDSHLQFDAADSKTFGGDGKRHFYKLKSILSFSAIGTDINKATGVQS